MSKMADLDARIQYESQAAQREPLPLYTRSSRMISPFAKAVRAVVSKALNIPARSVGLRSVWYGCTVRGVDLGAAGASITAAFPGIVMELRTTRGTKPESYLAVTAPVGWTPAHAPLTAASVSPAAASILNEATAPVMASPAEAAPPVAHPTTEQAPVAQVVEQPVTAAPEVPAPATPGQTV